jgi:hypothetical protein
MWDLIFPTHYTSVIRSEYFRDKKDEFNQIVTPQKARSVKNDCAWIAQDGLCTGIGPVNSDAPVVAINSELFTKIIREIFFITHTNRVFETFLSLKIACLNPALLSAPLDMFKVNGTHIIPLVIHAVSKAESPQDFLTTMFKELTSDPEPIIEEIADAGYCIWERMNSDDVYLIGWGETPPCGADLITLLNLTALRIRLLFGPPLYILGPVDPLAEYTADGILRFCRDENIPMAMPKNPISTGDELQMLGTHTSSIID